MLLLVRWIRTYNGIQFDWSVRTILSSTIQIYWKKEKENSFCLSSPSKRNNIHLVISSPNEVQNSSTRILYREINHTRIYISLHHIFSSKCINRIDSSLQISSPLREREREASLSSNLYKSGFIIFRFGGCLSAPNVFLTLYHHGIPFFPEWRPPYLRPRFAETALTIEFRSGNRDHPPLAVSCPRMQHACSHAWPHECTNQHTRDPCIFRTDSPSSQPSSNVGGCFRPRIPRYQYHRDSVFTRILVRARTYIRASGFLYTHHRLCKFVYVYIYLYIYYIYTCVYMYTYIYTCCSVVCSPLGNGNHGTKTHSSQEKEGWGWESVEGRKGHGEEEEDRLVARIRFRTVSNDTGQDTTMFSKILIPRHLFLPSFFLLFPPSFFSFFFLSFFLSSFFFPLFFFFFATCSEPWWDCTRDSWRS